jgi:hypothetical protein
LRAPLLEPGKEVPHFGERPTEIGRAAYAEPAEAEIILDAHRHEELALLGHEAHSVRDTLLDAAPLERPPVEDGCPARAEHTHDGAEHGGLSRAVRTEDRDDRALRNGERDVPHGLDAAVRDAKLLDGQERSAQAALPR